MSGDIVTSLGIYSGLPYVKYICINTVALTICEKSNFSSKFDLKIVVKKGVETELFAYLLLPPRAMQGNILIGLPQKNI